MFWVVIQALEGWPLSTFPAWSLTILLAQPLQPHEPLSVHKNTCPCTYGSTAHMVSCSWSPVTDSHLQITGYLLLYIRSQCHLGLTLWHHVPFCHSAHLNLQLHICYQRDRSWHQSESDLSAVGPYHLPCPSECAPSNRRPQTGP